MLPRLTFVVGISADCKAERRLVDTIIERYGTHVDFVFVHTVLLPVGYLVLFDSQVDLVQRRFAKYIEPLLQKHNIFYRLKLRQASTSMWQRQSPSILVSLVLCAEAKACTADALVVGGSGHQNCVRATLIGPRVSSLVLKDSPSPVLLLGHHSSQSTLPSRPSYEFKEHEAARAA